MRAIGARRTLVQIEIEVVEELEVRRVGQSAVDVAACLANRVGHTPTEIVAIAFLDCQIESVVLRRAEIVAQLHGTHKRRQTKLRSDAEQVRACQPAVPGRIGANSGVYLAIDELIYAC